MEELRAESHLRALVYQKAATGLYNRKVRPRRVGDDNLVLRKVEVSDPGRTQGKQASNRNHRIKSSTPSKMVLMF
ncbi:hypothetical protein BHE74_00009355 [Ensete ventricosum]|nr:hypothetical protein GW17_00050073 [Ensete ventricosum]RWW82196.1 hypothetical protein BHE74_00009355 [Ensete ventricosum]RZR88105.1 hypothetical protein BHM03_00015619 [Ensete ventricosum]